MTPKPESDGIFVRSKQGYSPDQPDAFECGQMIVRRSRRISQRRTMPADGRQNVVGAGFEQTGDERIGMLRREGVGSQTVSRQPAIVYCKPSS